MTYKLKQGKILNVDIKSPDIVCAEFSDNLLRGEAERMVNALNHGHDMLMIYKSSRDDLHIANVLEMLAKMEEVYAKWSEQDYNIRRNK